MKITTHKIVTFEIEVAEIVKTAMSNLTDIMLDGIKGDDNDLICMNRSVMTNIMQIAYYFTVGQSGAGLSMIKQLLSEGFATYLILPKEITDAIENDEEVILRINYNGKYIGSFTGEIIEY
jgi:hypothetical protein